MSRLLALALLLAACSSPAPRPAPKPAPAPVDSRRVQALYDAGVDAYARGDMAGARRSFEEALRLDPGFRPAASGLRRLSLEAPR